MKPGTYETSATIAPSGRITIRTDWARMPPRHREAAVHALREHLGCEHLRKASTPEERVDPRYHELSALIEAARRDWTEWGRILTRRVLELLDEGLLLPMTPANEAVLRQLFDDHRLALTLSMDGEAEPRLLARLQAHGLVSAAVSQRGGYTALAYRLGRGLDLLKQHERPVATRTTTLATALQTALAQPLSAADEAAVDWARKRAGELITRTVQVGASRVTTTLDDHQLGSLRSAVAAHVEGGAAGNLKHDLAEALAGGDLQNDLDRIVRTEMHFAHGYGAYVALKTQAAARGDTDPQVYRVSSINACHHCRRIWGPPNAPVIRHLSEIERWEAQGGNVGVPAAQWGPVVGPVHPNCFPAGVRVTTSRGDVPIETVEIGDRVLTHRGRWRTVTGRMSRHSDLLRVAGLPVSPEHPFLTGRGWVRAAEIQPGDEIAQPRAIPPYADADDAPAIRHQALGLALILSSLFIGGMPISAIDLNGDHEVRQRQIDQVARDLMARTHPMSKRDEQIVHLLLEHGLDVPGLCSSHASDHRLGLLLAPHGRMRGRSAAESFGRSHLPMHVEPGLGCGPGSDPRGLQSTHDCRPGDPEGPGEGKHGCAGAVRSDESIDIDHYQTVHVASYPKAAGSATVFNLAVDRDESYVAEGLVVHNCACSPLALWRPEFEPAISRAADEVLRIFGRF